MNEIPNQAAYCLETLPPFGMLLMLSMQHVLIIIVDLAMPVLLVKTMGGTEAQTAWMVQMSIVAICVGTILQIQRKGIGSGYLIPHSTTSIYLAPSLLAVQSGGLAIVAGMTLLAGSIQAILSRLITRFPNSFPLHLAGLVLVINGCVLVHAALGYLIGNLDFQGTLDWREPLVGIATLSIMSGLFLKGTGMLRTYGLGIGMGAGYLFSLALGIEPRGMGAAIRTAPLFSLPNWQHSGLDFDISLCIPFVFAAFAASAKSSGLIVQGGRTDQAILSNDHQRRLKGGLLADGIGTILSGLLGGLGTSMSAANASLTIISRAKARCIGYGVSAIFFLLIFFPKLMTALIYMPASVMGGVMACIGTNLIMAGCQMIRSEPLNTCGWLTVILPFCIGLWIELDGSGSLTQSSWMATILSSSISTATLLALVLHALFLSVTAIGHGWRIA